MTEFHYKNINLYLMDCIEFMKQKPDKCYDLAIVNKLLISFMIWLFQPQSIIFYL
jgi:hypothetical protein